MSAVVLQTGSPELEQELRTARGFLNNNGKLQIIAKEDWRQIIHRSPDRLDAVVMAVAGRGFASFGGGGDVSGVDHRISVQEATEPNMVTGPIAFVEIRRV